MRARRAPGGRGQSATRGQGAAGRPAVLRGLALGGLGLGGLGLRGLGLGGGGGLAHLIIRLVIWRAIWRLGRLLWRVPTFGHWIVLLIVLALVALAIFRARRGRGWRGPRGPGSGGPGRGQADPFGDRAGDQGPRDW